LHAVKDRKGLIRTNDPQNFDKHAVGLWSNNENSVCEFKLPDFVLRNEVSDGMRNVAFGRSMFESRVEDANTAISYYEISADGNTFGMLTRTSSWHIMMSAYESAGGKVISR
jgi:hypothetical protein